MAAARRHRALWLAAAAAAAVLVACAADEKESTRMVDDYQAVVKVAQAKRKQGAGEGAGADGAACRAAANEPACALRNGCAWCLRAGTGRRGAAAEARSGIREDEPQAGAEDARRCFAWRECTGPVTLCELRASKPACSGAAATESSCVWCESEGRCLNVSAKGLEASRNAQCKGCDGQFDSGRGANSSCPEVSESAAHAFTLSRTEKIGVVLALSGNVLISVSLNTQKYAHNQNEMRGAAKLSYLKLKLWWIGLALMAVGETGNFLAYAYAPATVVAPLGAVSVVSNCFLASCFLKEHIGMRNILGVCLAIVGSVIIVLYAPSSDRQLTMDVLVQYKVLKYMTETSFVVMVTLIVLAILVLFSLKDSIKKRYVVVYTLICSLTGALTVMCIKGVSTALVLTLQGNNQFYNLLPWVLVAIVIITMMIQLKYLNLAMMHFGASEVVPVYYVLFTFCSIMAGVLLFKEYHQHCPLHNPDCHYTVFFFGGCLVTFTGVHFINTDRKTGTKEIVYSSSGYRDALDDDAEAALDGVEIETEGLLGGDIKSRPGKNSPSASTSPSGHEMNPLTARNHAI